MDRSIKVALDAHDALKKHMVTLQAPNAVLDAVRGFEENSAIRRWIVDLELNKEMARLAAGPFQELHRIGIEHGSLVARELEKINQIMAAFDERFRLPELAERVRLLTELPPGISETLKRYEEQQERFRQAIEGMRAPWLDVQENIRSMGGLAALHGIGHAVRNMPAFGENLGAALRVDLGDWRDKITWQPEIFTNLGARSDFYVERGFNTALTDFPATAFEESVEIAGLDREPPALAALYGEPVETSDNEQEEEELNRTNMAHDWLLRLETQVRRFIDEEMRKAFGPDWPKHRLPSGLYELWKEKQQKAEKSGSRTWPLVSYADFTDYMRIIGKKDNWNVFAPFFGRVEDVQESFQRLHPIRLDTMHARPITQDDELLLYVEVRRLVRVMTDRKK